MQFTELCSHNISHRWPLSSCPLHFV